MQEEQSNRPSFFDDDDLSIVFQFCKPEKSHQKELNHPPVMKGTLLKQVSDSSTRYEGYYALHNRTLACYKNSSAKAVESVLDLGFSKLRIVAPTTETPQTGFSLTKNGNTFTFFSSDKQAIEDWIEALKETCVLNTFHDDFKALKMIGRGSFAKVYLVESKTTGKMYAVKAFTKEGIVISNKNNAKPSMLNEIDIMRSLEHENIIKLYEVHETENSIYLVLELIQGKSLQDTLKKSSFKEEYSDVKVLNMIRSILDALAYLATKDIMHRDLKPDNILLDKESKIKIADFGLATLIDLPEYIFKKCGTPGYIAPEVFKYDQKNPKTNYDAACDVFSAGAIFFYMLFGFPFFEAPNASEILRINRKFTSDFDSVCIIKQELKNPASKIPKDALDLLLKLVELDPAKRITASEALCHPYFIPVPQGMSKISGTNDLISNPLSKQLSSPAKNSPKHGALNIDHALQNAKLDSPRSPAIANNKERFAHKNSFYLDMGKPELNGRTDTLTQSGSTNNSVLLKKVDSNASVESNNANSDSPSSFSNQAALLKRSRSLKPYNPMPSNGQSFLKAAIFRNMQKNNTELPGEELKEDSLKVERRRSDNPSSNRHSTFSPNASKSPDRDSQGDSDDSPGLKSPGKAPQTTKRRFQPFTIKTNTKGVS